jgi:hypothetical protein
MTSEQVDRILLYNEDILHCTFDMVDTKKVKKEILVLGNVNLLDIYTWKYIEQADLEKYVKGDRSLIKTFHVNDIVSLEICCDLRLSR